MDGQFQWKRKLKKGEIHSSYLHLDDEGGKWQDEGRI